MEYTVYQLGTLAGISSRTLRYYDEIGLLKPARINSSGYRIYGQIQVERLQHILFYRELGLSLEEIRGYITATDFDEIAALREHRARLLDKKAHLEDLIENVDKSIAYREGKIMMTDQERFAGFKRKLVEDNEAQYGPEIREKYGNKAVDQSNQKVLNMTAQQLEEVNRLDREFKEILAKAYETGDPAGSLAQQAADLHRQWLCFSWNQYSKAAHAGLAQMYVDDPRFTAHYDEKQPGTAAFLRDAILIYTGK